MITVLLTSLDVNIDLSWLYGWLRTVVHDKEHKKRPSPQDHPREQLNAQVQQEIRSFDPTHALLLVRRADKWAWFPVYGRVGCVAIFFYFRLEKPFEMGNLPSHVVDEDRGESELEKAVSKQKMPESKIFNRPFCLAGSWERRGGRGR